MVLHRSPVLKLFLRRGVFLLGEGAVAALLPLLFFFRFSLRTMARYRRRSIWTGTPIITLALKAKSERSLGFDAITVVRSTYLITNQFDLVISDLTRGNRALELLITHTLFLWVCCTADRVHAYTDGGFLPVHQRFMFNRLELFCYRVLGVKLFIWTYGADVRIKSTTIALGEPNCCSDCTQVGVACVCDNALQGRAYAQVISVAKAVFSMGDMIEYTPGSRNNLFFWPIDFSLDQGTRYQPIYPDGDVTRPLRVVHAPNHRMFKGTRYLEAAVSALQAEGVAIELVLVERVPNDQALAIYRTADVIFDQCLIGFHGYFALEAMALGKPVICFIRDPERYLLEPEKCPILNVHRDQICEALRALATVDRHSLCDTGRRSRDYVEQYYSVEAFSDRLGRAYKELAVEL
jgi:hypothetical protein